MSLNDAIRNVIKGAVQGLLEEKVEDIDAKAVNKVADVSVKDGKGGLEKVGKSYFQKKEIIYIIMLKR